jgi:hypothetical protein
LKQLPLPAAIRASSLSDLKNRSEKIAEREQILSISLGNSCSIAQESGEIWAAPQFLQPIPFKSDRLLVQRGCNARAAVTFAHEIPRRVVGRGRKVSGG